MHRREFLAAAGVSAVASTLPLSARAAERDLPKLSANAQPIGAGERQQRIARAAELMRASNIDAVLIESGSTMVYFTGIEWWRSERLTGAVMTREGAIAVITPFFEEPSVRQTLAVPAEVLTWNEDEDPLRTLGTWLSGHGLAKRRIGIEETVRYFAVDRLEQALPEATIVNANPVVRGCRMVKSASELALMQTANDITMAAYRDANPRIAAGMTPDDIGALIDGATRKLGASPEFALVLLGEATAYPHGSRQKQVLKSGDVVLLDCGCTVKGYQSDISRSFVFGEASKRQRQVWDQMHRGQQIAFEAAQVGVEAGKVDDAVRAYYQALGYGPGYKLPGTSHRTGHGIGLDGHEPVNLVHGETTRLAPGMCFSDEPGIYIPGEFGIRLEDCFHMTASGPRWFSTPPQSIDDPI